jgi:sugar lactone lactonase YvrE
MEFSSGRVTTALSVHGTTVIHLGSHVIYRYNISGALGGLAVDQQGHVYISGAHDIRRLSPDGTFRDIVLSKHASCLNNN